MTRALVLSGGGAVGIAWQTGFAAGLTSRGVDLGEADFILGTSAGSATGAQIALGRDMAHRVERYKEVARASRPIAGTSDAPRQRRGGFMQAGAQAGPDATPEQRRAVIGRFALEAETEPEERFMQSFRYLGGEDWPRRYACTAVDAETGDFVVWDESSKVDLIRAVSSSCAVPGTYPPITINGRRYIDGGMRSATNADLAKGHDLVLILTMMTAARSAQAQAAQVPGAQPARMGVQGEVELLRESGSRVETLGPDEESAAAFGGNMLGGSTLAPAAEAGMRQGVRDSERVRDLWH